MQNIKALLKRVNSSRETGVNYFTIVAAPIVLVLAGVILSYLVAATENKQQVEEIQEVADRQLQQIASGITERMNAYQDLLISGASLFAINGEVTRLQWANYVDSLNINQRLPGTLGVGYAQQIQPAELQDHIQTVRNQGFPDYEVQPDEPRDIYTSIIYIAPFNQQTRPAFGYDMFSEPTRRIAMEKARDSGDVTVSSPVELVSGESNITDPGILIFKAVYNQVTTPDNLEARQELTEGYTYTALRVNDLINELFKDRIDDDRYTFKITDLDASDATNPVLYEPNDFNNARYDQTFTRVVAAYDHTWKIEIALDRATVTERFTSPVFIFLTGIVISVLFGGMLFLYLKSRLSRLALVHEEQIQQTKTDLLALASHQLRTPASGVKQYLGMIQQGYAGDISDEQKNMIDKAFQANERQIEIINQLLYVAKADAGQLALKKTDVDMLALWKDVIDEQSLDAKQNSITVTLSSAAQETTIKADKKMLRMAIENLLSNAIKYSKPDSTVTVTIKRNPGVLVCRVTDEGVGIAIEDQHLLFRKFSRIENELSSQVSGSGIGLFLAKQISNAHGGDITINSALGLGSTFSLTLPIKQKSKATYRTTAKK